MKPLNLSEKSPEDRAYILAILGPPVEYSYSYDAVKLIEENTKLNGIVRELLGLVAGVVISGGFTLKNMERIAELRKEYGEK